MSSLGGQVLPPWPAEPATHDVLSVHPAPPLLEPLPLEPLPLEPPLLEPPLLEPPLLVPGVVVTQIDVAVFGSQACVCELASLITGEQHWLGQPVLVVQGVAHE